MYKVKFNSQREGYAVSLGDDVIRQQLKGGRGRYYIDVKRNTHTVDVNWKLSRIDYDKMMAFWRVYQNKPAAFLVDLVIDKGEPTEYQANFIPSTFKPQEINGNLFQITAQLEIVQANNDLNADEALISQWVV